MNKTSLTDEYWMAVALVLAGEGIGLTRPNPPVGAVVVKNNRLIGMGYHPRAGQPHAEIFALKDAGNRARGGTLYVTLEPCSTFGRTPPCTDAIISGGIKRVVYGCVDPNPSHAGRAGRILRKAGIQVSHNVLGDECRELVAPFRLRILSGRPYVTLKLACTFDGRIADRRGTSKWISGIESRTSVQQLRRTADAILVGAETVRKDNPSLLPKPAHGRLPFRIILAGKARLPVDAKLFTDRHAACTRVFTAEGSPAAKQKKDIERHGARIVILPSHPERNYLPDLMKSLADLNCMHVVCEGGGKIASALLHANLVDQLYLFYAPVILGGDAKPSFAGAGWTLDIAPAFDIKSVDRSGHDILVIARPHR